MPPCVESIRNSRLPSADDFQPMPAFWVHPNKSPDGHSRSMVGVSGKEPDGPDACVRTSYSDGSAESKGFIKVQGSRFRVQGSGSAFKVHYAMPPARGGVRPGRCQPFLPGLWPAFV